MSIALTTVLLAATAATLQPKNVILIIGDGVGLAHHTVARHLRGAQHRTGTMPVVGLMTTPCADRYVTDSAAGATALATGVKTNYEMVSLEPATGAPLMTVLEIAEKAGKATGLVTTGAFWDATPAAFAAHATHRDQSQRIMDQMVASGAEVIAGAGLQWFGKEGRPAFEEFAAKARYTSITSREQLDTARGDRLLAVFPGVERDMDSPLAPLPVLAQWAIDRLSGDPQGFFLMIEHEGTDSASHQNQSPDVRAAMTSLDEAVGVALDFAAENPNTLVVVTSDHETGGLRITETKKGRFRMEWSETDHTATAVPVFAYGPGAAAFGGMQDNTDVGKKLLDAVR